MSELYNNIEILCKQKGISITTMCKEAHVSRGSLTDLKSGRSKLLSTEAITKIANYFDVEISWLMNIEPSSAEKAMVLFDDDTREILDTLRKRPEMRTLFKVARDATKEDIETASDIIERFKKGSGNID